MTELNKGGIYMGIQSSVFFCRTKNQCKRVCKAFTCNCKYGFDPAPACKRNDEAGNS